MEGIFKEFENENALRSYPFAAGCPLPDDPDLEIPAGLFVDAAIYPVNPSGAVYLSGVSEDGMFSISDGSGVIMTGYASGSSIELRDASPFSRHSGTIIASSAEALSEFAGRGVERDYGDGEYAFSSSCVFPVVIDGVVSLSVGGAGSAAGSVGFSNGSSDDVRVSSGTLPDGRSTLRFDVLPSPGIPDGSYIKRVICVVDGQTPFRIERLSYNTVLLKLYNIDRDYICSSAHRENSYEMADTCECEKPEISEKTLPDTYNIESVYIPPDSTGVEDGIPEGADNAFFLVVPNILGEYANPISITLEDGVVSPKTGDIEVVVNGSTIEAADGAMKDDVTSKGVVIQVPGLSGGNQ